MEAKKLNDGSFKSSIVVSSFISVFILSSIFYFSRYGLDITDEGFYLNSISNPWLYGPGVTFFSFVYHFFYLLFAKNFYYLRLFNLLTIFLLSWTLIRILIKKYLLPSDDSKFWMELLIINLSTIGLTYVFPFSWLITPSYNSLNFSGLLLSSMGLLLLPDKRYYVSWVGGFLLGIGGGIVFLAKPSSAVLLACCVITYLFLIRKINFKVVFIPFLSAILIVASCIYFISPSIVEFIDSIKFSFENYKLIESRSIFRLDLYPINSKDIRLVTLMGLLFFSVISPYVESMKKYKKLFFWIGVAYLFGLIIYYFYRRHYLFNILQLDYIFLPLFAFASIIFSKIRGVKFSEGANNLIYLGCYFFLLPYVFTFGTSNSYWHQAQLVAFFWLLATLCFISTVVERQFLLKTLSFISLLSLILMLYFLQISLTSPYRQNSFLKQNHYVLFKLDSHSELYINKNFAKCMDAVRKKLAKNGFEPQTSLVDFSLKSPSLVYLLNGRALGMPWLMDIGSNTVGFLNRVMSPVFKDIKSNWILMDSNPPNRYVSKIMQNFSLDLNKNYDLVVNEQCRLYDADGQSRKILIYKPKK